jgi:hypothetical protein
VQSDSNILTFNRQKQILEHYIRPEDRDDAETIRKIAERHRCTPVIKKLLSRLTAPEVAAIALIRLFIEGYGRGEGCGLFCGISRYSMLDGRIKTSAARSATLYCFWGTLLEDMQVDVAPAWLDEPVAEILSLSLDAQSLAVAALCERTSEMLSIARLWADQLKLTNEKYAQKAGKSQIVDSDEMDTGVWAPPHARDETLEALDLLAQIAEMREEKAEPRSAVVEVPAVTANSCRHSVVRYPGWMHLCTALGLDARDPGRGELNAAVEALFVNGGNIASGAKQPANPEALANMARSKYPLLDLLGGVITSFDLGESALSVNAWLVCKENEAALQGSPAIESPNAKVSAFQMLDNVTATRMATGRGVGQMIYNYETLAKGSQILVRLTLKPFTKPLTLGALFSAVETYRDSLSVIAGQSARGMGHVSADWIRRVEGDENAAEAYENYLAEKRDELLAGLIKGTLCTGSTPICL